MYSSKKVAEVIHGKLIQRVEKDSIEHIAIDSRQILNPIRSLFFALAGSRQNGHDFLNDAYAQGCRNMVIQMEFEIPAFPANFILVEDTLEALQRISAWHRSQFNIPVIGITGSNGKTIVKEWLSYLLAVNTNVCSSPKSYNSQVGVPLSVWQLRPDHDIGIFEAGISEPGEMDRLAQIIQPTLGIFTNIGSAHQQNFDDRQQKAIEKSQLFQSADSIIYCQDYTEIQGALSNKLVSHISWSSRNEDAHYVVEIEENRIRIDKLGLEISIPFSDKASLENAVHVAIAGYMLGIPHPTLVERMKNLPTVDMRMQVLQGRYQSTIVSDVYNTDLDSLQILLRQSEKHAHSHCILVISDILQTGLDDDSLYRIVGDLISNHRINTCLTVGTHSKLLKDILSPKIRCEHFESTMALKYAVAKFWKPNALVLFKGARQFSFEEIVKDWVAQHHITQLEINLSHLAFNLKIFERHLGARTHGIIAMIKANAYGAGAVEIARFLSDRNIQYLAVAYADEGVVLREQGIKLPILVLNTEMNALERMFTYGLEAEIYSMALLQEFLEIAGNRANQMPIHLKMNSGMNRLGFDIEELEDLADTIQMHGLYIQTIFSHLAASEDPAFDNQTNDQIALFQKSKLLLEARLGQKIESHILNSAGIIRFGEKHAFDLVRVGIGMYGIGMPTQNLKPVMQWTSKILQIRKVGPQQSIGYGYKDLVDHERLVATIGVGYADGFFRALGNGSYAVRVKGQLAKTVGNICMDVSMIDITDLDGVKVGDNVLLFGLDHPIEVMAKAAGTIPYEILVRCSDRVKRIYINE